MHWQFPSDKDLRENGMLDRSDLFFKTPLKWVYLFFIVFVLFLFWLVPYLESKRPQKIKNINNAVIKID